MFNMMTYLHTYTDTQTHIPSVYLYVCVFACMSVSNLFQGDWGDYEIEDAWNLAIPTFNPYQCYVTALEVY